MRVRGNDVKKNWYRSERFFHTVDGWWASTRENTELGPFESETEASNELCLYIREVNMCLRKIG